jgi:hypothetical protein
MISSSLWTIGDPPVASPPPLKDPSENAFPAAQANAKLHEWAWFVSRSRMSAAADDLRPAERDRAAVLGRRPHVFAASESARPVFLSPEPANGTPLSACNHIPYFSPSVSSLLPDQANGHIDGCCSKLAWIWLPSPIGPTRCARAGSVEPGTRASHCGRQVAVVGRRSGCRDQSDRET